MKISVLLPTRNGGSLLGPCISGILDQGGAHFELVVADNANTDQTAAILRDHSGDERLVVVRSERALSVVDNWNLALDHSDGDYILMMGDDDFLLPGALARLQDLIRTQHYPDCFTFNAWSYVSPNAIEGIPASHYRERLFQFSSDLSGSPEWPYAKRLAIIEDLFRFRPRIPLNMQTTVFSRKMVDRLERPFFRPPFPDHLALGFMLLKAENWGFVDQRLLVVGISPKSFGHFVYSHQQDKGLAYLGIGGDFPTRLAGNELLNHMHLWLTELRKMDPALNTMVISRPDYVIRQFWWWLRAWRSGEVKLRDVARTAMRVSAKDWVATARLLAEPEIRKAVVQRLRLRRSQRAEAISDALRPLPGVLSIREFASWVDKHRSDLRASRRPAPAGAPHSP